MAIEWATKSHADLRTIVDRYTAAGKHEHPVCLEARQHIEDRQNAGLDRNRSIKVIWQAAVEGRYLQYKDISTANGAEWNKVWRQVPGHLVDICKYSDAQGWPLLTAIVVNGTNLRSGALDVDARNGFIAAARMIGKLVAGTDAEQNQFLRSEQARVFNWAKGTTI